MLVEGGISVVQWDRRACIRWRVCRLLYCMLLVLIRVCMIGVILYLGAL